MTTARHAKPHQRSRMVRGWSLAAALAVALMAPGAWPQAPDASAAASPAFTTTVDEKRVHLIGGVDQSVDERHVSVSVDLTTNLRDRQPINVTWAGAHPTGGTALDVNSYAASEQEYPVVVMQCRGVDDPTAPAAQQLSQQTCWTQTPDERYVTQNAAFPPFRIDRYAAPADRTASPGLPAPFPSACSGKASGTDHWVPFVAADGTVYGGGPAGCAGLAPEAVTIEGGLTPGNTTYGTTDLDGSGSAKFIVNTSQSNASLGCSSTVPCSLVIVPIIGISCDPVGAGLPAQDQPGRRDQPFYTSLCTQTGNYPAGLVGGATNSESLAVSGRLWWSASNWRNRVSVPLSFAPDAAACDLSNATSPAYFYGSQNLRQAMQQWAPTFCDDPKLFPVRLVQTGEPQAKNLLLAGSVDAAIQALPPDSPFTTPTVQAPIALSGFAIAFVVDGRDGKPITSLKLNARLIAKLLTQSYAGTATALLDYPALQTNPLDIGKDPEFRALNPSPLPESYAGDPAAALYTVLTDNDVMSSLTSYLNEDPEARAWMDGTPDPWGMVVNTHYKGIALPVKSWPFLDPFIPTYIKQNNPCLSDNPVPWFPLIQAPVADPNVVALNMQYGYANSQTTCKGGGTPSEKLGALGRLTPGFRVMFGIVSLADAARFQLNVADLQTQSTVPPGQKFTDATGRTFAGPTDSGLRSAAAMLVPDDSVGTWQLPYHALRTTDAGANAYPGTLLLSVDVPTSGIPSSEAAQYATFLRYAIGPGQTPGLLSGQLAPGYLPLTADNGLSALATYTSMAADAVAAGQGAVPSVTGATPTPTPTPSSATTNVAPTPVPSPTAKVSASAKPSVTPSPSSATPAPSSAGAVAPAPQPTTPTAQPTASSKPADVSTNPVAIVAAGVTSAIFAGPLGTALPMMLGVALVAGLGAIATIFWGRA